MKKIFFLLIIILFSATCNNHNSTVFFNNSYKHIYKQEICIKNKSFPQLILIPYFEKASQLVPNCKTYPVHQTALALIVFYHVWLEYFGDLDLSIKGMLQNVMIEWDTKKKTRISAYDIDGQPVENRNIIGLVKSNSIIWVWQGYHHKISESSLMHELVHLALRAKNGSGDPDHEGHKYRGWTPLHTSLIVEANSILRAYGL